MLGNHALQPHQAGVAEQVRAHLALLEVADKNFRRAPGAVPGWSFASTAAAWEILAVADQDIESIEPPFGILLAGMPAVDVRPAVDAE